jgi:hypothetical protein
MEKSVTGIPTNKIASVVESFIFNNGATKVIVEQETAVFWRVTAYF